MSNKYRWRFEELFNKTARFMQSLALDPYIYRYFSLQCQNPLEDSSSQPSNMQENLMT